MTPEPDLQAALNAVYAAFQGCKRPTALDAASGRDPKRILARLFARPLAELTADDFGGYMGWAMTTVGRIDEYKHFVPRILELCVLGPARVHLGGDPESLARKIAYGDFPGWPAEERATIVTVFDRAWRQALRASSEEEEAEDWLRGLICLGQPIEARLAAWLASDEHRAGLHLADAVSSEIFRRSNARPSFGGDGEYAVYATYSNWLAGPGVRQRLERLILEVDGEDEVWRLEQALEVPMPPYPDVWLG